jgi:hypothetical protein
MQETDRRAANKLGGLAALRSAEYIHVCALEMFLDLIKRKVVEEVIKVQKSDEPFFHEGS